jgi:hypothetical protein
VQELDATPWNSIHTCGQMRQLSEGRVVRWLWTDGPLYDLRPEFFRRHNISRGRRLETEPADRVGCYYYGLDERGRVAMERYHYESGDVLDTFYTYDEALIEGVGYRRGDDGHVRLNSVVRLQREGRFPASYDAYLPGSVLRGDLAPDRLIRTYREIYTYQDGRLCSAHVIQLEGGQRVQMIVDEAFVYDSGGRLSHIHQTVGDEDYLIYQRPLKGQTIAALYETIRQRLLDVIPAVLAHMLDAEDPIYCLALIYDLNDENCLPPLLALGSAQARTMLIEEYHIDAQDYLWDPEEFSRYGLGTFGFLDLEEQDQALDEACYLLNQQLSFLDCWDMARDLLNTVAHALNRSDWKAREGLTSDFVAYAVDVMFEDFDDNFTFGVPPEAVERLTREGLF